MCEEKPSCGPQANPPANDILTTLLALASIGGAIGSVVAFLLSSGASKVIFTLFGYAVTGAAGLGAVAGGLGVLLIVGVFLENRCNPREGESACWSGVVNHIEESFSSATDWVFPFSAQHDRVDVTLKCTHWKKVGPERGAHVVHCAGDSRESPVLWSFYHNHEVCAAATGALYGAAVGAGIGIILGIVAAVAIGCAATLFIGCLLALLVAAVIAAACALAGAWVGGMAGKALAAEDAPKATGGAAIATGHYLTVRGKLRVHKSFEGAVVAWWVETTTLHGGPSGAGEGAGGGAPFAHTDPDANLLIDGCPPRGDVIR
jgi:hypothetical protein